MRLLELYTTVQGEGPNVGKPTTFVRFAGCNMRCPGWPCDTPYSIYPEIWRKEAEQKDSKEVFLMVNEQSPKHVCITGGEPLLQPRHEMMELLNWLTTNQYTVDIFTNGSRPLPRMETSKITYVMDWKLPGSGEGESFLGERTNNLNYLTENDAVKLVIKDVEDTWAASARIDEWYTQRRPFQIYVGAAWGEMKEAELVGWLNRMGYYWVNLNVQVHKFIFDPEARRI